MVRWSADDIIYEDEQILVCRKHSGMAVQSARVGQMDLESELRNYRNGNYIGIVQRLDQPVEGVLVFGKTPQATAWLNKQHQNGMMKKEYLAVFTGTPVKEKQGIWEDYLIKDGKTNTSRVTGKKDRMAKKAVLSYRIMDWRDDRGLAEIRLGNTATEQEALTTLGRMDLAQYADTHPMALSGGQKQRLAVADGYLSGKELLIFDEPTSGLDYGHMLEVSRRLRELAEQGLCVVVITHDGEFLRESGAWTADWLPNDKQR